MNKPIKFLITREVKAPNRANRYDAGIDFYVPEFTPEFLKTLREKNSTLDIRDNAVYLKPQERILIPAGVHCQMANNDRALIAANKSGIATKQGLVFGAQIIDYEYQGEIHLSLINTGSSIVEITPGQKIIQFLEMPIFTSEIEIFDALSPADFYEKETTRGAGGFGSTDKK